MYINWDKLKLFWQVEILGGKNKPLKIIKIWRKVRKKEQAHYLFWFRLAQYLHRKDRGLFNYQKMAERIQSKLIIMHGIDIMLNCEIGPGLSFAHRSGIVIAGAARIGENLYMRQNTTIGIKESGNPGLIYIGNNVDIGAHTCIIGNDLRIGDNVTIGAMAFVNRDIPDNTTYYTTHSPVMRSKLS